jgi:hypothetical protein
MPPLRISPRALNRATLSRQWLLEREPATAAEALRHLVGLQAQAPLAPYVGLWTRLQRFDGAELASLIEARAAVRTGVMRATLHLVDASDFWPLRALAEPILARVFAGPVLQRVQDGLRAADLVDAVRRQIGDGHLSRAQLRGRLAELYPGADAARLAEIGTYLTPLVQPPPRGIWGRSGGPTWADAARWLGLERPAPAGDSRRIDAERADAFVLRYLGAFGPAAAADAQAWSGLTRLSESFDRLRPNLVELRDEAGRTLFDLPDAPRPGEDAPAPIRFLPEYDNLLLGHADRTRVNPRGAPVPLYPGNGAQRGEVLIDGAFEALWEARAADGATSLDVVPFGRIPARTRDRIEAEGRRLLRFLVTDGRSHARLGEVRVLPPDSPDELGRVAAI